MAYKLKQSGDYRKRRNFSMIKNSLELDNLLQITRINLGKFYVFFEKLIFFRMYLYKCTNAGCLLQIKTNSLSRNQKNNDFL